METEGRATLKGYFQSRSFPTQDQFAQLIDSSLNLADDGVAVDGAGNLGVGTDAPAARLDVRGDLSRPLAGTVSTAAGSPAVAGTGTTFLADLAPGVPVRIGTEDAVVLAVASDVALTLDRPLTAAATAATVQAGGPLLSLSRATGDAVLRVDAAGRVGLGTATPGAALDVAGTVRAAAFSGPGTGLTSIPSSALEGLVPAALVPPLDASAIATGVIDPARLPPVSAAKGPLASTGATTTPLTGTVTVAAGSAAVVGGPIAPPPTGGGTAETTGDAGSGTAPPPAPPAGVATKFVAEVAAGDAISIAGETFTVAAVADDTHLTLDRPHTAGAADVPALRDDALFSVATGAGAVRLAVDRHGSLSLGDATSSADATVHGALTAASFAGSGAGLTDVPASALTGALPASAVPPLDAAAIATGVLAPGRIPPIDAATLTGVLDPARLPPIPASSVRGALVSRGAATVPLTGTVQVAPGSTQVVGGVAAPPPPVEPSLQPTRFLSEVHPGDPVTITGESFAVRSVQDDAHLTLDQAHFAGADGVQVFRGDTTVPLTGTVRVAQLSAQVVGGISPPPTLQPTSFLAEIRPGDAIAIAGETFTVVSVEDDAHLTLDRPHTAGADAVQALRDADPLFAVESGAGRPRLTVDHHGMVTIGDDGFASGAIVHGLLAVNGDVAANGFSGSGAGLTTVPAAALAGEVPAASIPPLDAAAIATGVLDPARIPSIDAAKITGVLSPAQLPAATEPGPIDASTVTTGVLDPARIPELDASKLATGVLDPARIPPLPASALTGQLAAAQLPADVLTTASTLAPGQIPALDAAKVATGTLDPARIPPIDASRITGVLSPAQLPDGGKGETIDASQIVSGFLDPARIPGPMVIADGRLGLYAPASAALQVGYTPQNAAGYDFGYTPLLLNPKADNGGSVPAPPVSVLALAREGVNGQSYANMADFRLSRYEAGGTDARTQLDVALTDGAFVPNTVLSVQSGGRVGMGTPSPQGRLHVSVPVPAAETLDQSNYVNNPNSAAPGFTFAQSFTVGISGLLTRLRVQFAGSPGGTVTTGMVQINRAAGTVPHVVNGPLLYKNWWQFPCDEWVTAVVDPPVAVSAGDVLIFTLATGVQMTALFANNDPYPGGCFLGQDGSSQFDLCFETYVRPATPVEMGMVVTDEGRVGIGTETPSEKLEVNGNVKANAFPTTSDARFKADVGAIEAPLETLSRLRGVRYRWRRDEHPERGFGAGVRLGMVAQEVEPVIPSMVYADADGSRSLEYAQLCALLVEAVKELGEEQAKTRDELARLRAWAAERGWTEG